MRDDEHNADHDHGLAPDLTSQLAMPTNACDEVYASAGYEASVKNFANANLAIDNVFSDGSTLQLASVTGNKTDGYVVSLIVGIAA